MAPVIPRQVVERWDAGYPRVSTAMQVEREALKNQVQALEAYADAQGLNLRLYPEEGMSAKDVERPKLQELLADVRAGRVRSVVVTRLDRISRSLADLLELMRLFENHDVKFISLRDNIDTSGPVGRFMLHILGAIAELERAITAERVAENMKLRARRGKWNGGLAPYARRMHDGQLDIVPEEVAILQRMRTLLLEKRSWRGVATALNREGHRTRGWEPVEHDGRIVRKGHAPQEWTSVSAKRVLLQPINTGALVYNRRRVKGRTHVPRHVDEHVVVEGFCEPIFSRAEMDELLRVAMEIAGTPPGRTGSTYLLSGLVYCRCGSRMYPVKNYVSSRRGRHSVVYYRCRRASHNGTCDMRQVPASVLEPAIIARLEALMLDVEGVSALAQAAEAHFATEVQPLLKRRSELNRQLERLDTRARTLLELVEDRLIGKEEFAARKQNLEGERLAARADLSGVDAEINARSARDIDIPGVMRSMARLIDVYAELDDPTERRRLLESTLDRLIVHAGGVELHVPEWPSMLIIPLNR